jgi:VIT1/CCC1 family predicted Fe2+/Mn2+ transporter
MPSPIKMRTDYSAPQLRVLAKSAKTLPLVITYLSPASRIAPRVSAGSLVFLAGLGALGASVGGASILKPTIRVTFWGAFAMGATAAIGALVGHAV